MERNILEGLLEALNLKLQHQPMEKSVSLRIRGAGNILITGTRAYRSDDRADCAIIGTPDTFGSILEGGLGPVKAVMLGRLKVSGDAGAAMAFGRLFG
ncbi:SCP2 sterol-binding domain-containing protein [Poseidonocella sp. HB161398]|uniref:SCP2 sterol-binding domain-containing protein n=1 Tax=Poseidonocella sp. HB161398 TaxID=2320855 RepID=UPI00148679D5|nr:SCP2 sterol-binding domain-containing protein [Poseidonocella sp. HB161398]